MDKIKFITKYWYLRTLVDPADTNVLNQPYRDKVIGHEIDVEVHYKIYENLTLQVEMDYMIPGDYRMNEEMALNGVSLDNAWKTAWGIVFEY